MMNEAAACKVCIKCREAKMVENFNRDAKLKSGLNSWCKTCLAADRAIKHAAKRTSEPSPEQMLQMLSEIFYVSETSPSGLRYRYGIAPGGDEEEREADSIAGALGSTGYWTVYACGFAYQVHRIVFGLLNDRMPVSDIDHMDGNGSNNLAGNLREVTRSENSRNCHRQKRNTSGKTGVEFCEPKEGFQYWRSSWYDNDGKLHRKHFSVIKLGNAEAKLMASNHRDEMIAVVGGYTERHGS